MKKYSILLATIATSLFITSASAQQKSSYTTYGADQDAVQALQDQWTKATLKADGNALQSILGDDYTLVTPEGETLTKAQEIALTSSDLKLDSLTVQNSIVKVYIGSATVTGMLSLKGEYKGKDVSGDYRFIAVWEVGKEPGKGGWKAVYRQLTKVKSEK